jgi:hypothetical protein
LSRQTRSAAEEIEGAISAQKKKCTAKNAEDAREEMN